MATENKAPKTDWLVGHLDYIRGLKSPTDAQKLLIFLSDKKDLTPSDQKKLDLIAKVERDFEKAKAGRLAVSSMLAGDKKSENEAARKARNHELIQLGLLVGFAGLENYTHAEILGLLIMGSKSPGEDIRAWAVDAAAILATKEPAKKQSPAPVAPAADNGY
jgi:hypothetical protein